MLYPIDSKKHSIIYGCFYQRDLPSDRYFSKNFRTNISRVPSGYRFAPPQSHSRCASQLQIAPPTPCFVGYHFAKTILNRFRSFTHRATLVGLITREIRKASLLRCFVWLRRRDLNHATFGL